MFNERAIEIADREAAYRKAVEKRREAKRNGEALSESQFKDDYSVGETERDKNLSKRLRKRLKSELENNKTLREFYKDSFVFETILFEHIELSEWLGAEAETILPSDYDDIVNGIDVIVRFDTDESVDSEYLGVAVDVTSSEDGDSLQKKFEKIKDLIENGRLSRLKHFKARGSEEPGLDVPRVIVGTDHANLDNLKEKWLSGDKKALALDSFQFKMLYMMRAQLRSFRNYSKALGHLEMAAVYDRDYEIISEILVSKISDPNLPSPQLGEEGERSLEREHLDDSVFIQILAWAKAFEAEAEAIEEEKRKAA